MWGANLVLKCSAAACSARSCVGKHFIMCEISISANFLSLPTSGRPACKLAPPPPAQWSGTLKFHAHASSRDARRPEHSIGGLRLLAYTAELVFFLVIRRTADSSCTFVELLCRSARRHTRLSFFAPPRLVAAGGMVKRLARPLGYCVLAPPSSELGP